MIPALVFIYRLRNKLCFIFHVEELLITNKSLIVASSWSHLYLLFKDARSFEYKVLYV